MESFFRGYAVGRITSAGFAPKSLIQTASVDSDAIGLDRIDHGRSAIFSDAGKLGVNGGNYLTVPSDSGRECAVFFQREQKFAHGIAGRKLKLLLFFGNDRATGNVGDRQGQRSSQRGAGGIGEFGSDAAILFLFERVQRLVRPKGGCKPRRFSISQPEGKKSEGSGRSNLAQRVDDQQIRLLMVGGDKWNFHGLSTTGQRYSSVMRDVFVVRADIKNGKAEPGFGGPLKFGLKQKTLPGRKVKLLTDELEILSVRIVQPDSFLSCRQRQEDLFRIGIRPQQSPYSKTGRSQPEITVENYIHSDRIPTEYAGQQKYCTDLAH
ncbi:hypothetical protein [Victivallis vadensis]|uniref:hypothetical protein n=1 Tax=Victivallis vadensis TaxID=172901 RepID=UPI003AF4E194